MTVIRPNSITGITSITAQANEINVFRSNGLIAGLNLNGVNFNTTAGISTLAALKVTGNLDVEGVLTYQDVTNVDSLGIGTFRTGINVSGGQLDVGSNIKLGNAGVITATSFVGSGANLTGLPAGTTINSNTNNYLITGTGTANTLQGEANLTWDGTTLLANKASGVGYIASKGGTSGGDYGIVQVQSGSTVRGRLVSDAAVDAFRLDSAGRASAPITFHTGSSYTERLRIDSTGGVIIGTGNDSNTMSEFGSNTGGLTIDDAGVANTGLRLSHGNDDTYLIQSSNSNFYISQYGTGNMIFGVGASGNERLRITSDGQIRIDQATSPNNGIRIRPSGWNYDFRIGAVSSSGGSIWLGQIMNLLVAPETVLHMEQIIYNLQQGVPSISELVQQILIQLQG